MNQDESETHTQDTATLGSGEAMRTEQLMIIGEALGIDTDAILRPLQKRKQEQLEATKAAETKALEEAEAGSEARKKRQQLSLRRARIQQTLEVLRDNVRALHRASESCDEDCLSALEKLTTATVELHKELPLGPQRKGSHHAKKI